MTLTEEEKDYIEEQERINTFQARRIATASQFKVGDYLIAYDIRNFAHRGGDESKTLRTNSYGTPCKYLVMCVDKANVSYVKLLDSKGKTRGELMSCAGFDSDIFETEVDGYWEWALDPDYAEAIILDSKEDYDPTHSQRHKKDMFREITEHNKRHKINCKDIDTLNTFLGTLTVGTILWSSAKKALMVDEVIMESKGSRIRGQIYKNIKSTNVFKIKLKDTKGRYISYYAPDLRFKALYTAQPRSYRELKDLNL